MPDLAEYLTPAALLSFVTLALMEVVLGIDNVVFISILTGKLPEAQRPKARRVGMTLALGLRLGLLLAISWVMRLTNPLFTLPLLVLEISGKDLILLGGGLFLIYKATHEIYEKMEVKGESAGAAGAGASFGAILVQIAILDIVFSLDSVITAVGMAQHIPIMVAAMIVAVAVMLVFVNQISDFVHRHPSMKILALSFLLLIGVMLVAEGLHQHINKGYIYFAMAFSLVVEFLNMRIRAPRQAAIVLHERYEDGAPGR